MSPIFCVPVTILSIFIVCLFSDLTKIQPTFFPDFNEVGSVGTIAKVKIVIAMPIQNTELE